MKTPAGGALEGLKIVEFAHVIAGPMAGTLMADLGATVVHVEDLRVVATRKRVAGPGVCDWGPSVVEGGCPEQEVGHAESPHRRWPGSCA